jgi:hypothetical protein
MIKVVSCISYDAALLPHFVEYYSSLGVDAFIISIDERVDGIWDVVERIAKLLPANIELVPASERQRATGIEYNNKEETRQRYIKQDDWIIPADLDEFIQFPRTLPQLIKEMNAEGATFIMGQFRDRIARHGVLANTESEPSIWEQYPLECNISDLLVQCWCHKVTLCRGDCELSSGHHNVIRPAIPLISRRCVVHHFKWRQGLIEALNRRRKIYLQSGYGAHGEADAVIDYMSTHGRIIPQEFGAVEGWRPDLVQTAEKKVVYTAIANDYDQLKPHENSPHGGVGYVAFTDATESVKGWQTRGIHTQFDDPCRNAKIHKILPHVYFPEAEYSLWIDGSIQLRPEFSLDRMIELFLKDRDLAVFRHPSRNCIYKEAEKCNELKKDAPELIRRQVQRYRYECYPKNIGLAECSVILRRHSEKMKLFDEIWWDEISKHSRRDQLSFNYVCWKLRIRYCTIPGYTHQNDFFEKFPHANAKNGQAVLK